MDICVCVFPVEMISAALLLPNCKGSLSVRLLYCILASNSCRCFIFLR